MSCWAHRAPRPPPWASPPALPGAPPPVRHAAFLDVGDDQGLPSLPAGRWGKEAKSPSLATSASGAQELGVDAEPHALFPVAPWLGGL